MYSISSLLSVFFTFQRTLKKVWKKSVKQNIKTYFCSSRNYFQLQKLRQGSSFVIQLDIIGWCKMSAGLIGSFETKFNEILWLSQSNFLWEEVRKRVGHASSLSKICLCLCFFYMSLCLSFYLSLSLYICVFNFFCVQPNGINMQAPFQLVHESLFPGF